MALCKTGSAYFAPALGDRHGGELHLRPEAGASGGGAAQASRINGFFMGVRCQIGSGGIEKITELKPTRARQGRAAGEIVHLGEERTAMRSELWHPTLEDRRLLSAMKLISGTPPMVRSRHGR